MCVVAFYYGEHRRGLSAPSPLLTKALWVVFRADVSSWVGGRVGEKVSPTTVGCVVDGMEVGARVGPFVVGEPVGVSVGETVGSEVAGAAVGYGVGFVVG